MTRIVKLLGLLLCVMGYRQLEAEVLSESGYSKVLITVKQGKMFAKIKENFDGKQKLLKRRGHNSQVARRLSKTAVSDE